MTGRAKEPIVELEVSEAQAETITAALEADGSAEADLINVDLLAAMAALTKGDVGRRGGRL